jgi:hypothetical protein
MFIYTNGQTTEKQLNLNFLSTKLLHSIGIPQHQIKARGHTHASVALRWTRTSFDEPQSRFGYGMERMILALNRILIIQSFVSHFNISAIPVKLI